MPRTEVYQLRLTKPEKDELAEKARTEGVSIAKLIRWRVGLDPNEPPVPDVAGIEVATAAGPDEFTLRVAKHKPFMSTRAAEAKARQELG